MVSFGLVHQSRNACVNNYAANIQRKINGWCKFLFFFHLSDAFVIAELLRSGNDYVVVDGVDVGVAEGREENGKSLHYRMGNRSALFR